MKLYFEKKGQGIPLFILHGVLGSSQNWKFSLRELENNFLVYRIDLRNHGNSFHHQEMNYEVMVQDLYDLIKSENLEKVMLLGHSMGGKLAIQLAHDYPEFFSKLIVVDISPFYSDSDFRGYLDEMIQIDLDQIESRKEVDKILSQSISEESIRQFLLTNLKRNKDGKLSWKSNLKVIHKEVQNLLKEIKINSSLSIPTLFIKGEFSNYINEEKWDRIQQLFSQVQLEIVSKSNHWPHSQNPEEFLSIVERFLK